MGSQRCNVLYPAKFRKPSASARREHRGKLKVFFGATASVGKTYAMLEAAAPTASMKCSTASGLSLWR